MPSLQEAARRFADAGVTHGNRYREGVRGKGDEWFTGASGAESNYQQGVQRAIQESAYSSGVREAGANSYQEGVESKGVVNWGTGVQAGQSKYQRKTERFAQLWDQTLQTPRGPRRSQANKQRITENISRFEQAAGGAA